MKDLARMAGILLKLAQAHALMARTAKAAAPRDSAQPAGLSPALAEDIRRTIMGQL